MPPPFGLTAEGFNAKTSEEVKDSIDSFQQTNINANWDVSTGSVFGQINGIMADELASLWEAADAVYDARDPDNATDQSLAQTALVTGTVKKGAQKATIICTADLDIDTYLAGTLVCNKDGDPDTRFENRDDITSTGGPQTDLTFVAQEAGPLEAAIGDVTTISAPVSGWNSITNTSKADGGTDIESDPALRSRRETELAGIGSSRVDAIIAAVSKVTGIISVKGLENKSGVVGPNGLPPHSFEIVVWDGVAKSAVDAEIAQAIWDEQPGGIGAFGTGESGVAVDAAGDNQTVMFSRVTDRRIFLEIDVVTEAGYVGDQAVKDAVVASGLKLEPGDDVIESKLSGVVVALTGVTDVTEIRLGFAVSPAGTANLTIGVREVATIADADIVVAS